MVAISHQSSDMLLDISLNKCMMHVSVGSAASKHVIYMLEKIVITL
jgi:hypothetical protein